MVEKPSDKKKQDCQLREEYERLLRHLDRRTADSPRTGDIPAKLENSIASEVLRDALRLLEQEQQRRQASLDALRSEIDKGRESGRPRLATDVLDRFERKYAKVARERE